MQLPLDLAGQEAAGKDALILAQAEVITKQAAAIAALTARVEELVAQNAALTKRVEELEARLASPAKTPDNSSLPPSGGRKASPGAEAAKPKKPHKGAARALHPEPIRIVEARVEVCPHCAVSVAEAPQIAVEQYERIELPEIVPDVTRVVVLGGTCPCCRKRFKAAAPEGLEPGSPWARSSVPRSRSNSRRAAKHDRFFVVEEPETASSLSSKKSRRRRPWSTALAQWR